jgi:putative FmdB family regulatory protein
MPIYEYQCEKCHHHLEALQKISDKPLRECPECGKHTLKRLLSAPLFRLAGSGWYETDFKSDKETKRNLAGRDETATAESGNKDAVSPTEAKPEKADKSTDKPAEKAEKKVVATKPVPRARRAVTPKAKARAAPRKTVRK